MTVRTAACFECGDRTPIEGAVIAVHPVRTVRTGGAIAAGQTCPGSGLPAKPLSPLAAALRARRYELGLTQAGLAERSGQPRSTIASLETGASPLRLRGLLAVVDALGCELVAVPRDAS